MVFVNSLGRRLCFVSEVNCMSRILLVDDEKNVLKSLSIGLRRYDYSVSQAKNGTEALRVLEENPCDIVISDVRMSPMDGYALAARVREKYPGTSIVLMSAYGFEEETDENGGDLVNHRLTKPFAITDLVQILREEEMKNGTQDDWVEEEEEGWNF